MKEDVEYSIEDRAAIRSDAEAILEAIGLPSASVALAEGKALYNLISVYLKAEIPLHATTYDLEDFSLAHVSMSEQNLLRLTDQNKNTKVFAPTKALIMRFPQTIGQAPVIYIGAAQREKQRALKLLQFQLPEWSKPIEYHLAFMDQEKMILKEDEVDKALLEQMQSEKKLPEITSFLSEGIALCLQVAPKTFSYRYPEFSMEKVAHWPFSILKEELEDLMERLSEYQPFLHFDEEV